MEEQEAISWLKRGDIGGLEFLVRRYQHEALTVAVLITRDYAAAEDLVQAAFLRAFERIDQYDAARPFAPWFLRGVINDARKAATRHRHLPLYAAAQHPGAEDADGAVSLAAAETREALGRALDQLTPGQRATIVARYYLELSERETARHLAIPSGTVGRRLHDARRRLRQLLPLWVRPNDGE